METRNFDLMEVTKDFNTDFSEQLDRISDFGLFKQIVIKNLEYKFRQDFICYIFILDDYFKKELLAGESEYEEEIDDADIEISMGTSLEDYDYFDEND